MLFRNNDFYIKKIFAKSQLWRRENEFASSLMRPHLMREFLPKMSKHLSGDKRYRIINIRGLNFISLMGDI